MSENFESMKSIAEDLDGPPGRLRLTGNLLAPIARYWWAELLLGILWLVIGVVVLKFNTASVVTVGVVTGVLFLVAAAEEFAIAVIDEGATRWLWAFFGAVLTVGGIISLVHPRSTFGSLAEILGFVFLLIGVMWTVLAFMEQAYNSLWWLGLMSGILMIVLAFVASGEFFVERAYTLLVFVGVWGLMKGITDIIRAFQLREVSER